MPIEPTLLFAIWNRAQQLPYESPSRGAVCVTRLKWGLAPSDEIPLMDAFQRARLAMVRTIKHSHVVHSNIDQYGNGHWAMFYRVVTQDGRRWQYRVEVRVPKDGSMYIADASVRRPDDEPDEVPEDDAPVLDPGAAAGPPTAMVACPCCGRATITERGSYAICPVCLWEDDGSEGGDLVAARQCYQRTGSSREEYLDKVRRPVDEEVLLRRFDAQGQEIK